jgi:hypothetical protein
MMIVAILAVIIPSLLYMSSFTNLNNIKSESERKATSLAVSGMQAFVNFPDTDKLAKLNYIKNRYYASTPMAIQLPEGTTVNYRQYFAPSALSQSNALNTDNAVALGSITQAKYWVVAIASTTDGKYTKSMVSSYDFRDLTATPSIAQPREGDTSVTGSAIPGADLKITVSGSFSYTDTLPGAVQSGGSFSISLGTNTLAEGDVVTITATDTANSKLESLPSTSTVLAQVTTPTPSVTTPSPDDVTVTGTAEAGAIVSVKVNGGTVYSAVAAIDGTFSVSLGTYKLVAGDLLSVTAKSADSSKGVSAAVSVTVPGRTATPIITPLLRANYTVVKGTAESNAHIVITINGGSTTYEGDASSAGAYSINVPVLNLNDTVKVTAKASGKSTSYPATMVVQAASSNPPASDSGVVLDVAPDGQTVIGFQDIYTTSNQLVITSGLGSYSTSSNIDLVAAQGITIQSGVSLTTTDTGNGSGLSLTTTGGDIVINNASLTNSGSSTFSTINIESAGNVYLQGAVLTAERSVTIKAAGNIYLDNAVITVGKNNENITFQLTSATGAITVTGLKVSQDAIATIPTGARVCGVMSSTSSGGIRVNNAAATKSFTCN